jgi:hypothetical protein
MQCNKCRLHARGQVTAKPTLMSLFVVKFKKTASRTGKIIADHQRELDAVLEVTKIASEAAGIAPLTATVSIAQKILEMIAVCYH